MKTWIPSWRKLFQTKASMTTPLLVTTGAHQPVWTPRRYDTLAEEGFQKNIVVYRCVSLISRGISSIPWRVYKGETPVEKHPLLSLLKNPNPQQSLSRFMEALSAYLLLAGNAYIEAVGIGKDP